MSHCDWWLGAGRILLSVSSTLDRVILWPLKVSRASARHPTDDRISTSFFSFLIYCEDTLNPLASFCCLSAWASLLLWVYRWYCLPSISDRWHIVMGSSVWSTYTIVCDCSRMVELCGECGSVVILTLRWMNIFAYWFLGNFVSIFSSIVVLESAVDSSMSSHGLCLCSW